MPQLELLEFFRTNTQDLPETTQRWFQLPNKIMEAAAGFDLVELLRRTQAGEDPMVLLGIIPLRSTVEENRFLEGFVPSFNNLMIQGKDEQAIQFATNSFELAVEELAYDQMSFARMRIFQGRALAQRHLLERGEFRPISYGHQLRSFCSLSLAADLMRLDLEMGYVTGQAVEVAEAFGAAQMAVLQRKVVEKLVGEPQKIVLTKNLTQVAIFSVPSDPEVRDMQRAILAGLIPD